MRIRRYDFPGELQCCNGLLAAHRGKRVKENLETVSGFQVIEEVFYRNSSTDKHRSPTQYLGVAVYNALWISHRHLLDHLRHHTAGAGSGGLTGW